MSVDPLTEKYVDWGPYVFSGNRVIDARELEGLEPEEIRFRQAQIAKGGVQARAEIENGAANQATFETAVRVVSPIEDIYGLATGKDFDGNNYDRGAALGMIALTAVPEVKGEVKAGIMATEKIVIEDGKKVERSLLNAPEKPGNAPTFKKDGTSVEIHHEGQNAKGPFQEMHKSDHRMGENYAKNHPSGQTPITKVERKEFNKARTEYWKSEFPK